MKSKLIIFAALAAIAFALYLVFRPGGISSTGSAVNPLAAHAGTTASNETSAISTALASLFGLASAGAGSATQATGAIPVTPTIASGIASFDGSSSAAPIVNYGPATPFSVLQASNPAPVIGGGTSFDTGNVFAGPDLSSLVAPPDYSADTDVYGDIES